MLRTHGAVALRQSKLMRIAEEAREQGGVLTQEDLGVLLSCDERTIRRDIKQLRTKGIRQRWFVDHYRPSGVGGRASSCVSTLAFTPFVILDSPFVTAAGATNFGSECKKKDSLKGCTGPLDAYARIRMRFGGASISVKKWEYRILDEICYPPK